MSNGRTSWSEIPLDHPIPLLHRRLVRGENLMVAQVHLEPGCKVELHSHISEQVAYLVSGHVRFFLYSEHGPDRVDVEMRPGDVLVLPPNRPHGVDAIEDSIIIDMLAPVGPMGVDQREPAAWN